MTVIAMHNVDMSQDAVPHVTVLHGSLNAEGKYLMPDCSNCPMMQLMEILMLQNRRREWMKYVLVYHAHVIALNMDGSSMLEFVLK